MQGYVLRDSCVTCLKKMGMSDTDIMKVIGHADAEMVVAYDESDRADNASKKVNLIS
jgi:integrase/recombinase XerD